MSNQDNKRWFEDMFADLARSDGRRFQDALADDVRWTVIGTTPWSGSFEGKSAVNRDLLGPLRARLGTITTVAERVHADGDHVIVEARGENRTVDGQAYCNTYCFVFRLADGKIREIKEYCDTELVLRALGERIAAAAGAPGTGA